MIRITGMNFIAEKKSSNGKNTYQSVNPKTLEISKIKFKDATEDEINKTFEKAEYAFNEIQKEKIPFFLKEVSNQIMQLDDQLLETANWETALGISRLKNERIRTCKQLEMFAEYIEKKLHLDVTVDQVSNIKCMNAPIGPVLVFPASNFPFAFGVCGGDTASAWAAGCPVVVKVHPSHPQTSELFAHAVIKSMKKYNIPNGFFSMFHGKNPDVSKYLILHPKVEAIGFTGSFRVGRTIFNIAANREKPIPVYAEMGSINPIFILDYKNDTAEQIANSITLGVGQFCTKPGVIFVLEKSKGIIKEIVEIIKEKKPEILLNENIKKMLIKIVNNTKNTKNVEVLIGGNEIKNINSFENTIFLTDSKTYLKNKNLHFEHFGPVAIFVKCKSIQEFIDIANKLEGQLTAAIYMKDNDFYKVKLLFSILTKKVGRIIVNEVPTGVKVSNAMIHGGPYPATTSHTTSVGMKAIRRFLRPIAFQNIPSNLLPKELTEK